MKIITVFIENSECQEYKSFHRLTIVLKYDIINDVYSFTWNLSAHAVDAHNSCIHHIYLTLKLILY